MKSTIYIVECPDNDLTLTINAYTTPTVWAFITVLTANLELNLGPNSVNDAGKESIKTQHTVPVWHTVDGL